MVYGTRMWCAHVLAGVSLCMQDLVHTKSTEIFFFIFDMRWCMHPRMTGAFCVANAHLFWDPCYEELKISQARALVRAAGDASSRVQHTTLNSQRRLLSRLDDFSSPLSHGGMGIMPVLAYMLCFLCPFLLNIFLSVSFFLKSLLSTTCHVYRA
jgi:hypothetical protein